MKTLVPLTTTLQLKGYWKIDQTVMFRMPVFHILTFCFAFRNERIDGRLHRIVLAFSPVSITSFYLQQTASIIYEIENPRRTTRVSSTGVNSIELFALDSLTRKRKTPNQMTSAKINRLCNPRTGGRTAAPDHLRGAKETVLYRWYIYVYVWESHITSRLLLCITAILTWWTCDFMGVRPLGNIWYETQKSRCGIRYGNTRPKENDLVVTWGKSTIRGNWSGR